MKKWYLILLATTFLCGAHSQKCVLNQIRALLFNIQAQLNIQFTVTDIIEEIFTLSENIESIVEGISICCAQSSSGIDAIESVIESLSECATIPVTAPATISAPGSYCLDNNSTAAVTIAASNVSLNLNNHSLGSVAINSGSSDVTVFNGFVQGGPGITVTNATNVDLADLQINGSTNNGILLSGGSGISLRNILITNPTANGIDLAGVSQVAINHITISAATLRGISVGVAGASEIMIENSAAYNNGGIGFNLADQTTMINCVAAGNGSYGIRFITASANAAMYAQDCVVMNNTDTGFRIENGISTLLNVTSINNGNVGFFATGTALVMFDGCVAESNISDGFTMDNIPVTNGSVRGCSAINNGGYGFRDESLGISPMTYVNNLASNNVLGNYNVPAATAPYYSRIYSAVDAVYWANVAAPSLP